MSLNQRTFRNWRFSTLTAIKAVSNAHDSTIAFCDETESLYKYDSTSGATADDMRILTTGAGGNTRWIAIAGKYTYEGGGAQIRQLGGVKDEVALYLKSTSGTYLKVYEFRYAGSNVEGVPNKIVALLALKTVSGNTIDLRVYDRTNSLTVAETTGMGSFTSNGVTEMREITITPANFPSAAAIFEVQLATTEEARFTELTMEYNT